MNGPPPVNCNRHGAPVHVQGHLTALTFAWPPVISSWRPNQRRPWRQPPPNRPPQLTHLQEVQRKTCAGWYTIKCEATEVCLVCHEKMWGNHKCRGFTKRNIERTDDIHTKGDVAEWRCLLYIVAKWPKACLVCHEKIWENQRKGRGLTKRNIERTEDIHTKGDVAKWRCLLYICIEYSAVCKHMHSLIYLYVSLLFPTANMYDFCRGIRCNFLYDV